MSRARLAGVHSQPSLDPDNEGTRVWDPADLRVVRSAKRARKLRRRGEEVIDTGERSKRGRKIFAWFVEAEEVRS